MWRKGMESVNMKYNTYLNAQNLEQYDSHIWAIQDVAAMNMRETENERG